MSVDVRTLEAFLRQRLGRHLPGRDAQRRFAPLPVRKGWEPDQQPPEARRAAALVLIYPHETGPRIALTLRRDDLPHHAGQVSLPGGAVDPGEETINAALREAHEEIGVDPASVRVVGALSTLWVLVSNFVLQPFVGVTHTRPDFRLADREVARLIEAPVAHLLDPARQHTLTVPRDGVVVTYKYFDLDGERVWGATAMILSEFVSLWEKTGGPAEAGPSR